MSCAPEPCAALVSQPFATISACAESAMVSASMPCSRRRGDEAPLPDPARRERPSEDVGARICDSTGACADDSADACTAIPGCARRAQAGTNLVPMTVRSSARPSTSSRSTPGAVGVQLESDARAARPHEVDPLIRLVLDLAFEHVGEERDRGRELGGAEHDPAQACGRALGRCRIVPPARVHVGTVRRDVREQCGPRLGMAVRLRELHDRAVRLGRHEKRLLPLGVGPVDVHGMEARGLRRVRARRRGSPP